MGIRKRNSTTTNGTAKSEAGVRPRRRRGLRAVAAVLAAAACASLVNGGAAEASSNLFTNHMVQVRHSGMCLNVAHFSPYNGAQVVQATCTYSYNEQWTMRYKESDWWTGQPYYQLVVRHTGKCLDVANGSKAHAAPVIQYTCNNGWNQQWRRMDLGNGHYFYIARHSDMCLNVAHASYAHAAPVVQAWCSNGTNEQWKNVHGATAP